jgi:hypothetical protein
MNRARAGAILLSLWSGLNLLLALAILVALTLLRKNAPALSILFEPSEIQALDAKVLGTVNALAVLANACIAGFCLLVLTVVWTALRERQSWALPALAGAMGLVQVCGFVSDGFLGHRNLVANAVSTAVLVAGLTLSAAGWYRPRPKID